jgi:hypothetical protein
MYLQKVISKKILSTSRRSLTKIAGSGSISQRYGSADPDPYQNFMDPQHLNTSNDPSISFFYVLCVLIRREQYEQELQAEDEQYIQADGLSGQQVCTHYLPFEEGYEGAPILHFLKNFIRNQTKNDRY